VLGNDLRFHISSTKFCAKLRHGKRR